MILIASFNIFNQASFSVTGFDTDQNAILQRDRGSFLRNLIADAKSHFLPPVKGLILQRILKTSGANMFLLLRIQKR